jgi:hypothetical protein
MASHNLQEEKSTKFIAPPRWSRGVYFILATIGAVPESNFTHDDHLEPYCRAISVAPHFFVQKVKIMRVSTASTSAPSSFYSCCLPGGTVKTDSSWRAAVRTATLLVQVRLTLSGGRICVLITTESRKASTPLGKVIEEARAPSKLFRLGGGQVPACFTRTSLGDVLACLS